MHVPGRWPQLAGQLARSWYIAAFLVPKLPEAAWRLFLTKRYGQTAKRDVGDDPVRGLALYRANFFSAVNWPAGGRVTLPVQVVVPLKDSFLSPDLVDGLDSWVDDLTVIRVDSGHWWPASRPAEFAELLAAAAADAAADDADNTVGRRRHGTGKPAGSGIRGAGRSATGWNT